MLRPCWTEFTPPKFHWAFWQPFFKGSSPGVWNDGDIVFTIDAERGYIVFIIDVLSPFLLKNMFFPTFPMLRP